MKNKTNLLQKNNVIKKGTTLSASLITYIILMTVIAMAFGIVVYGYSSYLVADNKINAEEAYLAFISCFIGLYLLLMVLFVLIISRQLTKPLELLQEAIGSYSNGQVSRVEYEGPKEFNDMVDSFNQLSEQLATTKMENQRLTDEKNKMLADISHDLKTPITVISGYARALYDGLIKEEEVPDYLRIISQKSTGVADLINQFYEYSKLEHPDYNFEMEKLNVAEFLRELLVELIDELEVNGYEVEVNFPDDETGYIMGNQMQLKRVFTNLIANTVAHTPKGTLLSFDMGCMGEKVLVRYQDNGGGISAEVADRIFEPFVVDDPARNKSGSGLGLSIAKKIVEHHGGTIVLERYTEKEVTSYLITLPLLVEDEEE